MRAPVVISVRYSPSLVVPIRANKKETYREGYNKCTPNLSVSVSVSVCQMYLHMRVALQAPQDKQGLYTLYSAESRGGSAAGRVATLEPSARKHVSACAVRSTRSNWVRHRPTACGLHCPFAAAVVTNSRSNLVPSPPNLPYVSKSSDRTAVPQRFVFSASPASVAAPALDALSLYRSACGHRTLTSIQSWCRTPGNQETTSSIAHRITGASPSLLTCQKSSRPCRSRSAYPSACSMSGEACIGLPGAAVRSVSGSSPYLQQNGWNGCVARDCSHTCPSLSCLRAHTERGPASGVAPSHSAVAILHCAFCANSVGDLCIAVQLVPVPGPPALSIMACCSGDSSACNLAAWTASAADRILDCSLANAMSRARLLGGTRSFVCTGAGRTISAVRLSATHGLISYSLLASFSTATLACSSTATLERSRSTFAASAFSTSGCGSRIGLFNASQILGITALCKSTADQYVACAANPSEQL